MALDTTALSAQLVATCKDGIVIADQAGTIVYWNLGAADIFGHPASRALGASLDLIVPERFRTRHWEGYYSTMRTGETNYADRILAVPALHRDGHRLSIEFRVTLLGDDPRHPAAIGAVIRDVTRQREEDRQIRARLAELEAAHTDTHQPTEIHHGKDRVRSQPDVTDTTEVGRDGESRSEHGRPLTTGLASWTAGSRRSS